MQVRSARALVIGSGALGNEVSKNLAMMGVNLIMLVDRDTVEMANRAVPSSLESAITGAPRRRLSARGSRNRILKSGP